MKRMLLLFILSLMVLGGCVSDQAVMRAPPPVAIDLERSLTYQLLVAEMAIQQQQLDVALQHYSQAVSLSDDIAIIGRAARLAHRLERPKEALVYLERWLEQQPNDYTAIQLTIIQLLRLERYDEAVSYWQQVLAIDAQEVSRMLLMFIQSVALHVDIDAIYQSIVPLMQQPTVQQPILLALAWLANQQADYEKAIQYVDDLLRIKPQQRSVVLFKAALLEERYDRAASLAYLESYLKRYPNDWRVRLEYAKVLIDHMDYKAALEAFQSLAAAQPNHPDILLGLGLLSIDMGDFDNAEMYLQRLNINDEGYKNAVLYYLGIIKERQKHFAEAIRLYQQVGWGEYHFRSKLRIVLSLGAQDQLQQALVYLGAVNTTTTAESVEKALTHIELLQKFEQWQQALMVANEALEKVPNSVEILYARSLIYERLDEIDKLEVDLKALLKQAPDDANVLNALGYTLADRTERYEEALSYIEKAYRLRPNSPAIIDSLGWVKYKLGDLKAAIALLEKALALLPVEDNYEIRAHLIEVLWHDGQQAKARKLWQEAMKQSPDDKFLLKLKTLLESQSDN